MSQSSRTWATIVYEESCKETWVNDLESLKIPCYISPLHDQDVQENNPNEKKKPHFHILMTFNGQKSRKNILELVQTFGGVGAEKIESKEGYLLYLCHLKSPGKHVYDVADVITLNGATEYTEIIQESVLSKYELTNQMLEWCDEYSICYFADLVDYARKNRKDWFKLLVDRNSHLLWEYIKSKTWKERESS